MSSYDSNKIPMNDLELYTRFNKDNHLCVVLKNISKKEIKNFKICFSLIYTIKNLKNAKISKNIGRYYELTQLSKSRIVVKNKPTAIFFLLLLANLFLQFYCPLTTIVYYL